MAPTSFLPRLPTSLERYSAADIDSYLAKLKGVYGEGAKTRIAMDSGYSSEAEEEDEDEQNVPSKDTDDAASDAFERAWTKDWLMALIKRGDDWIALGEEASESEQSARAQSIDSAVALVAQLSKITDSSSMVRQIPLPTQQGSLDVTLFDALPSPSDPTSVGLQTWGSAILLARRMASDPSHYGIDKCRRVCELGAGSGLLSIAWAKIAESLNQPVEIVSTDYHADVLANLARNIRSNDLSKETIVEAFKLDWEAVHASTSFARTATTASTVTLPFPFDEAFDTIIAADVVYGPNHALWLKSCVEQFLARPAEPMHADDLNAPAFHLMVPLRPTHKAAIATIEEVFPRLANVDADYHGVVVRVREDVDRVKGIGRADEQGYRRYEIVWRS